MILGLPNICKNKFGSFTCSGRGFFATGESRQAAFQEWQKLIKSTNKVSVIKLRK